MDVIGKMRSRLPVFLFWIDSVSLVVRVRLLSALLASFLLWAHSLQKLNITGKNATLAGIKVRAFFIQG